MRRPSRQRRRAAPSRKGGLNIRTSPCGQPRTDLQPSDYRTLILPHTRTLCCQCIRQHGLESRCSARLSPLHNLSGDIHRTYSDWDYSGRTDLSGRVAQRSVFAHLGQFTIQPRADVCDLFRWAGAKVDVETMEISVVPGEASSAVEQKHHSLLGLKFCVSELDAKMSIGLARPRHHPVEAHIYSDGFRAACTDCHQQLSRSLRIPPSSG